MRLVSLEVRGHRHADPWRSPSSEGGVLALPPADAVIFCDTLAIAQAALLPTAVTALSRLDLAPFQHEVSRDRGGALVLSGLAPTALPRLLSSAQPPALHARITLQPDPPLFRMLQEAARRDQDLAPLLAEGAVTLSVGMLATPDHTQVALELLGLRGADQRLPLQGGRIPQWLRGFGEAAASRLRIWAPASGPAAESALAQRWLKLLTSPRPAVRGQARLAAAALAEPPFSYGVLEVVEDGGRLRLAAGPDLQPWRAFGPQALLAADLACDFLVDPPSLFATDHALPSRWRAWLTRPEAPSETRPAQVVLPEPVPSPSDLR